MKMDKETAKKALEIMLTADQLKILSFTRTFMELSLMKP